jgi:hypothetical protein
MGVHCLYFSLYLAVSPSIEYNKKKRKKKQNGSNLLEKLGSVLYGFPFPQLAFWTAECVWGGD